MRLCLITDAWHPQVNGVVRTLEQVTTNCRARGHQVEIVSPDRFKTISCPNYPEIRLAIAPGSGLRCILEEFKPTAIHIATEGPLGLAARRLCIQRPLPFTTSYHTRFPEYLAARFPIPASWAWRAMRWFHRPSAGVMVATASMGRILADQGFHNILYWSRGVDTECFRPSSSRALNLPRPVFLYVGRVAIEKNLRAFLSLDLPGTKLVVGDGPQLSELKSSFPNVVFAGKQQGEDLIRHYASGDVFVFPSLTDTFGLVLLEALACGLPVAAYPVTGPRDVIAGTGVGILSHDLARAALDALNIDARVCRRYAMKFSWESCTDKFIANLHPAHLRKPEFIENSAPRLLPHTR